MRLDDLEALVHQRGRVDGDLGAHVPRRVGQRLLDARLGELLSRPSAERPSARRHDHPLQVLSALASQALRQGRMFGVDGNQAIRLALDQVHDELTAHHERLLVGQGEHLPGLQGGQRGTEAHGADHGVQHHVGLRLAGEHLRRSWAGQDLDAPHRAQVAPQLPCGVLVRDGHEGRHELAHLPHEELVAGARAEPDHLEAVGVATHDVERLRADGAGRPQDGERPHDEGEVTLRPVLCSRAG